MASNSDQSPVTFDKTAGFLIRVESSIEIGNAELWGSLDIGSFVYQTYDTSVGLTENGGWHLGSCDDIDFERSQDITVVEIGNVLDSGLFEVASEENNLTFSAREWKPQVVALALGTTYHAMGTGKDGVIYWGGGCDITSRPVVARGTNVSCNAASITDLTDGVDYITLTLYDCYTAEGGTLPFRVREDAALPITMRAKPVLTLTAGRRIGNLYLATD